ncbi:hypothetical protein GCM10027590_39850 [Nocardiopsis nanhaiensis]
MFVEGCPELSRSRVRQGGYWAGLDKTSLTVGPDLIVWHSTGRAPAPEAG